MQSRLFDIFVSIPNGRVNTTERAVRHKQSYIYIESDLLLIFKKQSRFIPVGIKCLTDKETGNKKRIRNGQYETENTKREIRNEE